MENQSPVQVPERPQTCLRVDFFIPRSSLLLSSAIPGSFCSLKHKQTQKHPGEKWSSAGGDDQMRHATLKGANENQRQIQTPKEGHSGTGNVS